jgi:hypothetical protein
MDSLDTTRAVASGAAILTASLLAFYFRKSHKGPGIETFPGPKPDFVIGNVRQFPKSHWRDAFAAFREQYGTSYKPKLVNRRFLTKIWSRGCDPSTPAREAHADPQPFGGCGRTTYKEGKYLVWAR